MPKTALLCLAFSILALNPSVASAAGFSDDAIGDGKGIIAISGDIVSGDADKFRAISLKYKEALVVLESDGGALAPAIEIGKIIKIAGYITYVPKDTTCTSSCALIWVAGSSRLMSSSANVGFHASYRDNNGRSEESGLGNALVGNYLTVLNLPQKAIVFATIASPDEIMWLTKENMGMAGIDFDEYDFEDQPEEKSLAAAPPVIRTISTSPPVARRPTSGEDWILYGSTNSGTVSYYDANSTRTSGTNTMVWSLRDHSKDKSVAHHKSKVLQSVNCLNQTSALVSYIEYNRGGNIASSEHIPPYQQEQRPLVPGSVGMGLWEMVCRGD